MGRVAAQYADLAVITSDNPRTESPMTIIRAIEKGFREIGHTHLNIASSRTRRAIREPSGWRGPVMWWSLPGRARDLSKRR